MSTLEEFESAPIGATARRPGCPVAVKITDLPTSKGNWDDGLVKMTVETLVDYDYVLDPPLTPSPATAREALDLAWDLAHPVREGQVIPAGTSYLATGSGYIQEMSQRDSVTIKDGYLGKIRTFDPLPDPEWTKAPAVLASHPLCADTEQIGLWLPVVGSEGIWEWPRGEFSAHWSELRDVTPLYPKEQDA